jgi:hypothetical protein
VKIGNLQILHNQNSHQPRSSTRRTRAQVSYKNHHEETEYEYEKTKFMNLPEIWGGGRKSQRSRSPK